MTRALLWLIRAVFIVALVVGPVRAQEGGVIGSVIGQIAPAPSGAPRPPARDTRQPAPPGTATLRGRIVSSDGQPLRKVQVRIVQTGQPAPGQPPENRVTLTDAEGRYEFKELRANRYNISAQKGGYVSLSWGQQRPNQPGKPIDVLDGQTIEKVDFALPRGGVITGRILDEFGEPTADVQVSAMQNRVINGARRLINAGRLATTDDIGEFRIYGLPPGDYYVTATFRNIGLPNESDDRSGYAPTYYPGTPDVSSAQKLSIGIGQTISDLTMALLPVRTVRISGTAVDSEGRPLRGSVMAAPRAPYDVGLIITAPGPIRPDGSFTINGLGPGEYTLQAQAPPTPGSDEREFASLDVTVGTADTTNVRLVSTKPSPVVGKVVFAPGVSPSLTPSTLRIQLQPSPTSGFSLGPFGPPAQVTDEWTFRTSARAGSMRTAVIGLQPGWMIKAVRWRGVDVTDVGLDVRANEEVTDLEIELTNRPSTLSGTVTTPSGDPVADYWVVLFARDPAKRQTPSRFLRTTRSDQTGRYQASQLPAGEYLAIALESVDANETGDPAFIDRLQPRATPVAVGEGESKTLDLKLSAVP